MRQQGVATAARPLLRNFYETIARCRTFGGKEALPRGHQIQWIKVPFGTKAQSRTCEIVSSYYYHSIFVIVHYFGPWWWRWLWSQGSGGRDATYIASICIVHVCCRWSRFGHDFASLLRWSNSFACDNRCKARWDGKYSGERVQHHRYYRIHIHSCTNICQTTINAPAAAAPKNMKNGKLGEHARTRCSSVVLCVSIDANACVLCMRMRLIEHFSHFETTKKTRMIT